MLISAAEALRLHEIYKHMEYGTVVLNRLKYAKLHDRLPAFLCENITKDDMDTLVRTPDGHHAAWPHPVFDSPADSFPPDDMKEGAAHCQQYEAELAKLEPTVKEFYKYLSGRIGLHSSKWIEKFKARCVEDLDRYAKLLLQICMERASSEMKSNLRQVPSGVLWIQPASIFVKPLDTSTLVDELERPLMTVKHIRVKFDDDYPTFDEVDPPLRLEMACRMYNNSLTTYQSLVTDGSHACLRFLKIPHVDSTFKDWESHAGIASYTFPADRNGFVCHLVNLLKNSDDYTKYFKYQEPHEAFYESDPNDRFPDDR